jgi:curved DNA-binding protein
MVQFIDYYKILEVDKKADEKEIKKSYRRLARKYHPDKNQGDAESERKFKQINEAYEVLGDAEKRKKYDQYGKDWMHAEEIEKANRSRKQQGRSQTFQGNPWESFTYDSSDDIGGADFSDFFNSMFGGAAGFGRQTRTSARANQSKGQDLKAELKLSITDILKDQKQVIDINGNKIRITIPAGVKDGQTIKIKGQGAPNPRSNVKGDLYLTFSISDANNITRIGNDLHKTINVNLYTAVLGGKESVQLLDETVRINIPAGIQYGKKIRLKEKGMPIYKNPGKRGDFYITIHFTLPTSLTEDEKMLFIKLRDQSKISQN